MTTFDLQEEESKNRRIAFFYTLLINGSLLLLFWFVTVWTAQENKPVELPAGGFEINYGTSDFGSGKVQTHNKPSPLPEAVESKPEEKVEVKKEIVKKVKPVEVPKVKPVKAKAAPETPLISSTKTSPVKVKDLPPPKVEPKPTTKPVEAAKPAAKPVPETPKVDEGALYKRGKSTSNGTIGTASRPGGNSNGDDKSGIGDKGQKDGDINESAIYKGPKGNGGGSGNGSTGGNGSLNLTGWTWTSKPQVNDDSDETGIIRFSIKIDENGDIISLKVVEKTVSASVAEKYRKAIERVTFKPTSSGERPATSSGSIIFRINPK